MVVIEKVYVACDSCSTRGKRYSTEIFHASEFGWKVKERLPKWRIEVRGGEVSEAFCPACKDSVEEVV